MHFGLQCSKQSHKSEVSGKLNKEFHIHLKWAAAQYTETSQKHFQVDVVLAWAQPVSSNIDLLV